MRAPPAPIPPRHRPSTGTTNHQPPHVPSAYASGYHRRPCPATQTTGSAWEPLGGPSPTPQRTLSGDGVVRCGGGQRPPGEDALCLCEGCLGLGTLLPPTARPWDVRPGIATIFLSARGLRVSGPMTNPTAHALTCWCCAPWGRPEGAPGAGAPRCTVWMSRIEHPPSPDRPSWGRAAGACCHFSLSTGDVDMGAGYQPHSAHSYELALCAVGVEAGGSGGGASPASVWGFRGEHNFSPKRPSLGRAAGARCPFPLGAGTVGMGVGHQYHYARSCELALCAVGAAGGRPGRAPLATERGVQGQALSLPQPPVLGACGRSPLPCPFGHGGCG